MHGPILVCYFAVWTTLLRALLVKAELLPATCSRCGLPFERSALGQPVCTCHNER
jgi:hypothetical protein